MRFLVLFRNLTGCMYVLHRIDVQRLKIVFTWNPKNDFAVYPAAYNSTDCTCDFKRTLQIAYDVYM